ncbi:metal-dependent hydrolase [Alkalithermobacter paradoxus]|uniref:Inner membrane protein n=1 Tax=Alkalithermobacter paradoxus TaxID=29349 RepID=A0A1V4IBB5_9FIRM|nr:inner membrane protein [[Clostridium] thermoalcaliphilum]
MKGSTHMAIGVLSAIQTSIIIDKPLNPVAFGFVCICSLLPDIDEQNSTISNSIIKSSFSKAVYRYTLYIINMLVLILLTYINKNLIFNLAVGFMLIILIESKLKHSLLRKGLFTGLSLVLCGILYYMSIPLPFISICAIIGIGPWLKHRGFTHSVFSLFLVYYFLREIEKVIFFDYIAFYGTISYASHLFLGDIFTKMGIPIFYPISNKKISLGFIKVGSILGNFLEIIYVLVFIIVILFTLKAL